MRVVHLIDSLGAGGAERSLAELLPRLDAQGIASTVVALERRPEGAEHDVLASGADVRFVPAQRFLARVRAVRRIVRDVEADVVHTSLFNADVVGRVAALLAGRVPVLTTLVNDTYGEGRRADPRVARWKLEAVRGVDRLTARLLTTRFVAITDAVADAAVRDLGVRRERIDVVPRGRDRHRLGLASDERRARARAALGIDAAAEVVVHVGRHEYQKGITTLLDAMAVLVRRRPVVLVQAGRRGNDSDAVLARIDELGLSDAVRVLGHRDDVGDVFVAGDVFAFPSRYEGLGGSLLEAMALGLAVVATDLPAVREVVEDGVTGDLVPVDDACALADAIDALLSDGERRARYGDAGRQRVEERFSLERSADGMAAALRRTSRTSEQP